MLEPVEDRQDLHMQNNGSKGEEHSWKMFSQCVWEVLVRGLVVVSDTVLRPIVHLHSAKVRAFTRLFSNSIGRLDDPFHVAL